MKSISLILILLILSIAISCKQSPNPPALNQPIAAHSADAMPSGNDQKGYLYVDSDSIAFIRWTKVDKKLSGQLQVIRTVGGAERSTQASTHSFEGISDGENISLNFTGSVWMDGMAGHTLTGTTKSNELILVIPQDNGILQPYKFQAADVEAYNQAVSRLSQGIKQTNIQINQQREQVNLNASQQRAVYEANQRVRGGMERVYNIGTSLSTIRFSDVLELYANSLNKMQNDYKKVKEKAAKRPFDEYALDEVGYAVDQVGYDLDEIGYRRDSLNSRLENCNEYINSLRQEIKSLNEQFLYLQQAAAANSTGEPKPAFSQNDVATLVEKAEAAIVKAQALTQQSNNQALAIEKQAKELMQDAKRFYTSLK
jgi:hypothetical protein